MGICAVGSDLKSMWQKGKGYTENRETAKLRNRR